MQCWWSWAIGFHLLEQRVMWSWQGRGGSNSRPTVLETVALPTELRPYTLDLLRGGECLGKIQNAGFLSWIGAPVS